ncbi:MAG: 2-octaprenyl-6-methoxyphenyl hydroxylase [Arenicellales bacterium WSBS_2016_MAG_OTU3]
MPQATTRISTQPARDFDVVIVGGGMAGASLACALGGLADTENNALRIAMIESVALDDATQPSFDERTVALTYSSKQIFSGLGVWSKMQQSEATPITHIHVSNRGSAGATVLRASDVNCEALGYVVPHRVVGQSLMDTLAGFANITLISPATVNDLQTSADVVSIKLTQENLDRTVYAKLAVLADGGRSPLAKQAGLFSDTQHYDSRALVTTIETNTANNFCAYERFTETGPLALLPKGKTGYAVVWTLPPGQADFQQQRAEKEFLNTLQQTFGYRAGAFTGCGKRKLYPLSKRIMQQPATQRLLALGNAAHSVHPVAGQGFNLGLRDVAELATQIDSALKNKKDIGEQTFLKRYTDSRHKDTASVGAFTDGLIKVFANEFPLPGVACGMGLGLIDLLPFAKRILLHKTMGMQGSNSPLVHGRPLN